MQAQDTVRFTVTTTAEVKARLKTLAGSYRPRTSVAALGGLLLEQAVSQPQPPAADRHTAPANDHRPSPELPATL